MAESGGECEVWRGRSGSVVRTEPINQREVRSLSEWFGTEPDEPS